VFQSYALWPHMTVRENIAYPLRVRKVPKNLRRGLVDQVASLVECSEELLARYPGQLSGGQQQRIALARGLVAKPTLILMDEPLSNLDARLREQVRAQIHELHRTLGFTAVFVTHDQTEALALGDRLAIMRGGEVTQVGSPTDIFESPATEYVADFIGMSNRFVMYKAERGWMVGSQQVLSADVLEGRSGGEVVVRTRPEQIRLEGAGVHADGIRMSGIIVDRTYGGSYVDISVDIDGFKVVARAPAGEAKAKSARVGDIAPIVINSEQAALFDAGQVIDMANIAVANRRSDEKV